MFHFADCFSIGPGVRTIEIAIMSFIVSGAAILFFLGQPFCFGVNNLT